MGEMRSGVGCAERQAANGRDGDDESLAAVMELSFQQGFRVEGRGFNSRTFTCLPTLVLFQDGLPLSWPGGVGEG